MASLATIVRGFVGVRDLDDAYSVDAIRRPESCRLRPLANEDVYLFVKPIDNRGVVRAADPSARRASIGAVASGLVLALLFVAGQAPAALNTMEGYRIQQLHQEQDRLNTQRAALDVEEARLLSPDNLNRLAARLNLVDPTPQQVLFLDGKAQSEARNRLPVGAAETVH